MNSQELRDSALKDIQEARAKYEAGDDTAGDALLAQGTAKETRAAKLVEIEERENAYSEAAVANPLEDRAVRGSSEPTVEERQSQAFEAYVRSGEIRAQSLTASEGGYLVPRTLANEIVRVIKEQGPMYDGSIVREVITSTGNLIDFGTVDDTSSTGALIAEAGTHGDTAVAFGQKTLSAYRITSGLFKFSREILSDAQYDIEGAIATEAGERLARKANSYLTTGSGSSQPQGIVTAVGTPSTVTAASNAIGSDDLLEVMHATPAHVLKAGSFMMSTATILRLRKLKDGEGRYVFQEGMVNGLGYTLFGRPVVINDDMVGTVADNVVPVLYGDFKKFFVRKVGGVYMQRSTERFMETGQVAFLAEVRIDGRLMDATAVKGLKVKPA